MNTLEAFARGAASRDAPMRVFDWDRAARRIVEVRPRSASAGLAEDWEWTGGCIFVDGEPVHDGHAYLASTWATPVLIMGGGQEDCFLVEPNHRGWGSEPKWPDSALAILKAAT